MTSRIVAIAIGIIAGCAVAAACTLDWSEVVTLGSGNAPETAAALSIRANRIAWTIAACAASFAVVALLTSFAAGIAETVIAHRRIAALSGMPAPAGSSNAGEWRVIFAGTSLAAPVAAALTAASAGTAPLLTLDQTWLDRLTLRRAIEPLPPLVLAADGTLALLSDISGTGWAMALAAGLSGWTVISFARYLTSLALSPFIARTMAAAVSASHPVAGVPAAGTPAAGTATIFQPSINQVTARQSGSEIVAHEIADMLAEPIERLADAADRLSSAAPVPSREQAVDTALAEIRAGIERLLAASSHR